MPPEEGLYQTLPTFLGQFLVYNSNLHVDQVGEDAFPRFWSKNWDNEVNELSMASRGVTLLEQLFLDQFLV